MNRFLINKCCSQHADTVAQGTISESFHIPCATAPQIVANRYTTPLFNNNMNRFRTLIFAVLVASPLKAQTDSVQLEEAYATNSKKRLDMFLESWKNHSKPWSDSVKSFFPDAEKEIYSLYELFYNPLDLKKYGDLEIEGNFYKSAKYLILQNTIRVVIVRYLPPDSIAMWSPVNYVSLLGYDTNDVVREFTIEDFRPKCDFGRKRILYYTSHYKDLITSFLGDDHQPLGVGGIMNVAKPVGDSENRKKFLEKRLRFFYGHWGGYWHIETHPMISFVIEENLERARLNYQIRYQGGQAYYEKKNGKWVLLSRKITWIE